MKSKAEKRKAIQDMALAVVGASPGILQSDLIEQIVEQTGASTSYVFITLGSMDLMRKGANRKTRLYVKPAERKPNYFERLLNALRRCYA